MSFWLFRLIQLKLIEIVLSLSALRNVSQKLRVDLTTRSLIIAGQSLIIGLTKRGDLVFDVAVHA